MKVACVMMQRNEERCLDPWLCNQGYLFGDENLFVVDHHSDNPDVLSTLQAFSDRGGHVMRVPATADYRQKGEFVSYAMRQVEAGYDFVLPLDCDEFVEMRQADGHATCSRDRLIAYFSSLRPATTIFEVRENFFNMLGYPKLFFALPYKKVFFRGGYCGVVDRGSHRPVRSSAQVERTRIVYVHFHHKSFERYRQTAQEKLRPFVDVHNSAALAEFRGPGWHLVTHLQKTEQEFYAIMQPDNRCFEFFELYEKFLDLGLDPKFCE